MNSCAHDIALWLESQGVGVLGGENKWSLARNGEPKTPPDCITVYDTGGDGPDTDELDVYLQTFQVRVRAIDEAEGSTKQAEIRELLIHGDPIDASTSVFTLVVLVNDLGSIGRTENGSYLTVANYRTRRVRK